ncbi:MAG: hypothetical protein ACYDDV_03835 [Methanoregula sp.]
MILINTTYISDALSNPTNVISICALVVSIASILVGYFGLKRQQNHEILSVRPICNIGHVMGTLGLNLWISNNGVGPMIIKSIKTSDKQGNTKDYPKNWLPDKNRHGNIAFWEGLENTSILNGNKVDLLTFTLVPLQDDKQKQIKLTKEQIADRDEIFGILKELTITVKYSDIYGIEQPEFKKDLSFFEQIIS